ncbi:Thiol-disulfide isomerase or thioredoxin [Salinibacillus kushneri]|uniref:Thiol-disulfide isomerase or thioredoxin n=1 Tax=Salinibacillus kushneri TaxID=237682 RepID=A0A1I0I7N7_9BACI|nr:TlpA disulfide reductase family protein [Salinibacillus kushneri]SET92534.1 Thiol-disulfide isomerase or thioredoxin [Salinibacillus kushneri]
MRLRQEMPELSSATTWLNGRISKGTLIGADDPSLIHFWSVSCKTCKKAMPKIHKIRDHYADYLNVIAIHMPRSQQDMDVNLVKEKAREHHITEPILIDNDLTLSNAFGVKEVPAYFLFDKDGKLRHSQVGGNGLGMLTKRIQRVLTKR